MKKVIILIIAIIFIISMWYILSLQPVSKDIEGKEVVIPMGSTAQQIAGILKENKLIKNKLAFRIFVKLNNISDFKAGTYYLKESMSTKEITKMLQTGVMYDPNQITITYLEGKTFPWLAKKIADITNNEEEDVYNLLKEEEYIDKLINKYWFITDDIKDSNIYYPLEGYLFPDTYALKNKDVSVEEIFEIMLDQMDKVLSEYKDEIEENEHSVHELLTVASIIEAESKKDEDRSTVASVIYNRLDSNMAIQSDVTTYYAIKVDMGERDLYLSEINKNNPYNTRGPNMNGKLPIGPIASVGKTSIEAAVRPSNTDYLYFVADKTGKLYFTKTNDEHNRKIEDLKSQGLWFEY